MVVFGRKSCIDVHPPELLPLTRPSSLAPFVPVEMERSKKKRQHESDEDLEGEEDNCRKRALVSRKQQFLKAYNEKWKCLTHSTKGPSFVHCVLCKLDFSCAHGGRNDCERHVASKTHKKLEGASKGTVSLVSMFQTQERMSGAQMFLLLCFPPLCWGLWPSFRLFPIKNDFMKRTTNRMEGRNCR